MSNKRIINLIVFGIFLLIGMQVIGRLFSGPTMMRSGTTVYSNTQPSYPAPTQGSVEAKKEESNHTVPWDYQIKEAKIGDLVGGDMVILPNNDMLPNDDNFATGDAIWILENMTAVMSTKENGAADVQLSQWKPIKSYRSKDEAMRDLQDLKSTVQTEIDLIGVYKTEFQGKERQFAVAKLPTGNVIKQPITPERYEKFKDQKKVNVKLEQIHEYTDYDMVMSKFRGWVD